MHMHDGTAAEHAGKTRRVKRCGICCRPSGARCHLASLCREHPSQSRPPWYRPLPRAQPEEVTMHQYPEVRQQIAENRILRLLESVFFKELLH